MEKCLKCKGKGRIKIDNTDYFEICATLGISLIIDKLIEDIRDNRFWKDCKLCKGNGYIVGLSKR